jgi:hypothetical protein
MRTIRGMKAARAFNVFAVLVNLYALVLNAALGNWIAVVPAVVLLSLVVTITWQTRRIHRRADELRPRPDYSLIASMEQSVWGEAFEHEGAPGRR